MRFCILYGAWLIAHAISFNNSFLNDREIFVEIILLLVFVMDGFEYLRDMVKDGKNND